MYGGTPRSTLPLSTAVQRPTDVVPEIGRVRVEHEWPSRSSIGEFARQCLQCVVTVGAVRPVREEILVLGVRDEQQSKEDGEGLLVDRLERVPRRARSP